LESKDECVGSAACVASVTGSTDEVDGPPVGSGGARPERPVEDIGGIGAGKLDVGGGTACRILFSCRRICSSSCLSFSAASSSFFCSANSGGRYSSSSEVVLCFCLLLPAVGAVALLAVRLDRVLVRELLCAEAALLRELLRTGALVETFLLTALVS